jgi:hypothetical protein
VVTSADFKATVEAMVAWPGDSGVPRPGETVLLGATAGGTWARLRIRRRYRWLGPLMVRGFVMEKNIDRLAIVVPDGNRNEAPRRFRVAFAARENGHDDPDILDRRLARLVVAARRQWSRGPQAAPKPLRMVFGRPWLIAVLLIVPTAELVIAPFKLRQVLSDPDSWLPVIPALPAITLYVAYLALAGATIVMVWRQTRVGYGLALALSAVQFVQPLALYLPLLPSIGLRTVTFYTVWSWSRPALIWLSLLLLYVERIRRERI